MRFGSGVGIIAGDTDLEVTLVRVRPRGAKLRATLRIENFRTRPAAEWGAEYAAFLKSHGSAYLPALVVLGRSEVIVRHIALPGVTDADAAAAIGFQLDGLHPFAESEVVHDYRRVGSSDVFTVAIAERARIDFYTALFAEAGIKLAGFTFSGGAVFSSLRLYGNSREGAVVAVTGLHAGGAERVEVYGESPSYPLFSACFDEPVERAAALATAEMRLPAETPVEDLADVLPQWRAAPENFDFSDAGRSRAAAGWAAGLAAACPRLGTPVNLLPLEFRTASSRLMYVPSIVLGVVLIALGVALAGESYWLERGYRARLNAEIGKLTPVAQRIETLDKRLAQETLQIDQLARFRRHTRAHLDIVLELTETLPPPAFLTSVQIDAKAVNIAGESDHADELLKKLDASPHFDGSQFTMPLARGSVGEVFRIHTVREGGAR